MVKIADKTFEINVERKKIRNIYLRVKDNTIFVTCPIFVTNKQISSFINEKRKWIYKIASKNDSYSKLIINDYVYYLGNKYHFVVAKGNRKIEIKDDSIIVYAKDGSLDKAITNFYEYGKKVILNEICDIQDKYLNILKDYGYNKIPEYSVKYLKSMWGCCYSSKNKVNISVRLIHFDKTHLEAILWHELLHFIIPNHSKRFYQVLNLYMPKYSDLIKELG